MQNEKLVILERLVDELLKEKPEESTVSQYMTEAGLPDSKNPIDRINMVLKALHFEEPQKEIRE